MNWQAIALTFKLACCVSGILLLIGMPIAYWVTYSRWRWKFIVEAVVALPIVLPPTVLGFYVLMAIGTHGWVGKLWQAWFDRRLAFTFTGLVIASVLYSLPFAVQPFAAAFAGVDRKLIHASWTLGASKLRTFVRVILPLSFTGILTGIVLSFAHTLENSAWY